jgi:hypothetical protein
MNVVWDMQIERQQRNVKNGVKRLILVQLRSPARQYIFLTNLSMRVHFNLTVSMLFYGVFTNARALINGLI